MIHFSMQRNGKQAAQVITLDNGKCIVSWPKPHPSYTVYDTEQDARSVHINHAGKSGDRTVFVPLYGDAKGFMRGVYDAIQDDCEGCVRKSLNPLPDYISEEEACGWADGYKKVHTWI